MHVCYATPDFLVYVLKGAGATAPTPGAALWVGTLPETPGKGASVTFLSVNTGSGGGTGGKYNLEICFKSFPGSMGVI